MPRKKRKRRLVRPPPTLLLSAPMHYHFAQCELDIRLHQLRRDGAVVGIEPKVFDVLTYLLQHRDRMVSKDELLDKLWPGQVVSETTLTRCITSVRKAVGDDGMKQEIIETHHGRGYRFIATVTDQTEASTASPSLNGISSVTMTSNGQSNDTIFDPLPLPAENEANEHAVNVESSKFQVQGSKAEDSASQNAKVKTQKPVLSGVEGSKVEDRRAGFARQKWTMIAATGVLLTVATIGVVRYWPSPTPNSQLRTPNSQPSPLSPQSSSLSPPAALPLPDKPSIIVLPFTNLSGDPGQEYFSDGLTDGLITELSRIPQLFVIARQSAFTYKGKQMKIQDISREMGVRYVLEGSVQRIEGRLRILAQLSDATTGEQLWAERYDLELSDTVTVQDAIRQRIAALRMARLK